MSFKDRSGKKQLRKNMLKITQVEMPLITYLNPDKKERLSKALKDVFMFIYNIDIDFVFSEENFDIQTNDEMSFDHDSVLLFSGGLDSAIGLSYCQKNYSNTLALYANQKSKLKPLIDNMKESLNLNLEMINGPQILTGFFTNTAGIFYILNGLIFSHKRNSPLIIAECGVTSYQPRFGPLNDVTFTTHPFIIESSKKIFEILLGVRPEIKLPFNDSTKSEMVSAYPEADKIKLSHSCLKTNDFSGNRIIKNCGTCYACIIRRLGITAAIEDPTEYNATEFLISDESTKKNLDPLLEFCYLVLKNFNMMDYPQREKIIKYDKQELFKRFALDIFSAVYRISKKETLPDYIKDYLKNFDSKIFEERLEKLKPTK
jgi:7-cyano-7-deazaguanine synthase in queuosine biosynthesis